MRMPRWSRTMPREQPEVRRGALGQAAAGSSAARCDSWRDLSLDGTAGHSLSSVGISPPPPLRPGLARLPTDVPLGLGCGPGLSLGTREGGSISSRKSASTWAFRSVLGAGPVLGHLPLAPTSGKRGVSLAGGVHAAEDLLSLSRFLSSALTHLPRQSGSRQAPTHAQAMQVRGPGCRLGRSLWPSGAPRHQLSGTGAS